VADLSPSHPLQSLKRGDTAKEKAPNGAKVAHKELMF
jgi:hypothetical protein